MEDLDRLAPGRSLRTGDGHTTWVRHAPAPPGRATVVLLHGITASADINWHGVIPALRGDFGVVAPDLRAHGRGSRARFTMEGCADDVVAALDHLDIDRAIVVGFSLGGAVAQTLARRHASRVAGLVPFATAHWFHVAPLQKRVYGWQTRLARATTVLPQAGQDRLARRFIPHGDDALRVVVMRDVRRHHGGGVIRAAKALSGFRSASWLGQLDVPTHALVTADDSSVPPRRQRAMAAKIPGAVLSEVVAGHSTVVWEPERVAPALLDACRDVTARAGADSTGGPITPMG